MSNAIQKLGSQIQQVKKNLRELGPMRPGSISRQYRKPREKQQPFHQISYTHRMKSRSEYVRPENLAVLRRETANFKRFRKLVDRWVDLALKLSQLKIRRGSGSAPS